MPSAAPKVSHGTTEMITGPSEVQLVSKGGHGGPDTLLARSRGSNLNMV